MKGIRNFTRKVRTRKVKEAWLVTTIWIKPNDDEFEVLDAEDFNLFEGVDYEFDSTTNAFELKIDSSVILNAICLHLEHNVTDYRKRQYKKKLKLFLEFLKLRYEDIDYA